MLQLGLGGPNYSPSVWLEAEKEIDGSRYNGDGPWVVLLRGRKRRLEWRCELAVRLHFPCFIMDKCFSFFFYFTPTILLQFHCSISLGALHHHTLSKHALKKTIHMHICMHTQHTHISRLSLRPPSLDPYTYVLQMVSFYKR